MTNLAKEVVSAKLIALTQPVAGLPISNPEELIAYCARVSSGRDREERGEDYEGLLRYCINHKHWSVFEMANAVVEVGAPRDISRQLLRHRSFSFQEFCVSGDTEIRLVESKGHSKKRTIEELYKLYNSKYWGRFKSKVRVWDEVTKSLVTANIKEVFDTGVKPTYKLTADDGSTIVATLDHKFLTFSGFKTLGEIKDMEGCLIGMNGQALYKDKEWLESAKQLSIDTKTGLQGIADLAGVTTHTIRKWLKKHNLQFTKKEVASYTEAWNKGLPPEDQPRFGQYCTEETRDKMRESSRKGVESEFYSGAEEVSWRKKVALWSRPFRQELLNKQGFKCAITGEELVGKVCHVDHIQPVYLRPDLAFCKDNLQVLSEAAHKEKTRKESIECRQTARWKAVKSVDYFGEVQTYDMEIDHESHNYVANKFITHNSQRYSDDIVFCEREYREQDYKNRQNSTDTLGDHLKESCLDAEAYIRRDSQEFYRGMVSNGVAKECARVILPEGLTMSTLYVNGTLRSWLHYLEVRDDPGCSQWEHVQLARAIKEVLLPAFPSVFGAVTSET